jgi:nucleotide-binding universal stress UspA family protein
MYRRILVVNDGSSDGFAALHEACNVAAQFQAELHVACVQKINALPATMVEVTVE